MPYGWSTGRPTEGLVLYQVDADCKWQAAALSVSSLPPPWHQWRGTMNSFILNFFNSSYSLEWFLFHRLKSDKISMERNSPSAPGWLRGSFVHTHTWCWGRVWMPSFICYLGHRSCDRWDRTGTRRFMTSNSNLIGTTCGIARVVDADTSR
jgi:hypothetical protein